MKIKWTDKITNEEVISIMDEKGSLWKQKSAAFRTNAFINFTFLVQ